MVNGDRPRRAVILGASNVVRALPTVVDAAVSTWGSPLELLIACGHGRSYGMESRVLGRSLPGIDQCGLWRALESRDGGPSAALLTDVGNDLLYGASVDQVVGWVKRALDRLAPHCVKIIVTELPLASLARLGPRRFTLMRTILFPKSRLTLDTALSRADELNARLCELANAYSARVVQPPIDWYGFDPIHIRSVHYSEAWSTILRGWSDEESPAPRRTGWARWVGMRRLRPERRKMFGVEQRREQPVSSLPCGGTISLF